MLSVVGLILFVPTIKFKKMKGVIEKMYNFMTLKETIQSNFDNIAAEINQLNNCRVYWVKFFEQIESKRNFIMVKVIAEHKDFDYKAIKNLITTKLFREAKKKLAHNRRLKNTLTTR